MARQAGLLAVALGLAALVPTPSRALDVDAPLDRLSRALTVSSPDGLFRARLSGLLDLEGYWIDQRPPALLFGSDEPFVNPRLRLFLTSSLGTRLTSMVQVRADRGFDPRATPAAIRFDEYLLRFAPFADTRLQLQVGKFATVVGNWVARHDSWTNPLINAPLPYEYVTAVSDAVIVPGRDEFLARRDLPDRKGQWLPIIWGPSYATGAAVFGRLGTLDYALEVKNAGLSSRPAVWDGRSRGLSDPTVSGRLGWRAAPTLALGVSASGGPYLRGRARAGLPAGRDLDAFKQTVVALDGAYAWRHLELWAELFVSQFEVPNVGAVNTTAYYLEGRYKLTPAAFVALRWNQQVFGTVEHSSGRARAWDRDAWRIDVGLGYRLARHLQAKLQYALTQQRGDLQQGAQLVALQVTLRF
jgi:hypothetical protein